MCLNHQPRHGHGQPERLQRTSLPPLNNPMLRPVQDPWGVDLTLVAQSGSHPLSAAMEEAKHREREPNPGRNDTGSLRGSDRVSRC
jgi:hypothetical protein